MLNFCDETKCTCCAACYSVCPVRAIEMHKIKKGLMYPFLLEYKCINCGMCEKVCPAISSTVRETKDVYAFKHASDEVRSNSSSGGAYPLFAQYVLDKGGTVFGAMLDEKLHCTLARAEDEKDAKRFCGSKYVQSEVGDNLISVAEDLKSGKHVLFCALPCQVAGLINYLKLKGIDRTNLLTADLICHGAPAPRIFEDYIKQYESKFKKKVLYFDTRVLRDEKTGKKAWGRAPHTSRILTSSEDWKSFYSRQGYVQLFYSCLFLKESCYGCPFVKENRYADFTIGDYWGIDEAHPGFRDDLGVSVIIANNKRAKELFFKLTEGHAIISSAFEKCIKKNPNLLAPSSRPENVDQAWQDYETKPYKYILKKYAGYKNPLISFVKKLAKKVLRRK